MCLKKKNVHEVAAASVDDTHDIDDVLVLGPITATPINSSHVNVVACKQKVLFQVKISAKVGGQKTHVVCKIDPGAETNILPKPIYDTLHPTTPSLRKSAVKLYAYGGSNIPTVGSCDVYVQGSKSRKPQQINFEVVDVKGPAVIGNVTAQNLDLLKLNWSMNVDPSGCTKNPWSEQRPYPSLKNIC